MGSVWEAGGPMAQARFFERRPTSPRAITPVAAAADPVMVAVDPAMIADDYAGVLRAIVTARKRAGLSQEALSECCGLPDRYINKVECWPARGGRGLGGISLGLVLQALGYRLALIPIDAPRARRAA